MKMRHLLPLLALSTAEVQADDSERVTPELAVLEEAARAIPELQDLPRTAWRIHPGDSGGYLDLKTGTFHVTIDGMSDSDHAGESFPLVARWTASNTEALALHSPQEYGDRHGEYTYAEASYTDGTTVRLDTASCHNADVSFSRISHVTTPNDPLAYAYGTSIGFSGDHELTTGLNLAHLNPQDVCKEVNKQVKFLKRRQKREDQSAANEWQ